MPEALLDKLSSERSHSRGEFAVAAGIVKNNLDLMSEGRVQVRIPTRPSFEPWARLPAVGGASGRGFLWVPGIGDEVLVAFSQDDLSSAFVLGGLWSTTNRPPATLPTDFITKRVIKTGLTEALGHEIELDDLEQSITITSSTMQKVTIDPTKIEMTNVAGTVSITLDNLTQKVSVIAAAKIELTSTAIEMTAASIDIKGGKVNITSAGPCTVMGLPIKLN
jgi:uncharacterized protein involved in type VI secretion and phage assembly